MKKEDLRALTPLIYSHVTPYGVFRLDLSERFCQDSVRTQPLLTLRKRVLQRAWQELLK